MSYFVISTRNLDLVLQTPEEVLAWVDSLPAADRAEVSDAWLEQVRATTAGDPWSLTFSVVERTSGITVGECAFKGPPDRDKVVEVAYGIDESHQGHGFATEATGALVEFALADERVRLVRAHTKSDTGASPRVLVKCGFQCVGTVIDPEDGLVHRWERTA